MELKALRLLKGASGIEVRWADRLGGLKMQIDVVRQK